MEKSGKKVWKLCILTNVIEDERPPAVKETRLPCFMTYWNEDIKVIHK